MANEDNESGYDGGSEVSLLSDISDSNSKKKPCEVCGSDAYENSIVTCLSCRETREHIYCMKMALSSVPPMWICEKCRTGVRIVHQNITSDSSNQLSQSPPVVEDAASPMSMHICQELSDSESAN